MATDFRAQDLALMGDLGRGDHAEPSSGPDQADRSAALRRLAVLLLAPMLASVAVLIVAGGRLDAPFSPSFTGFNTAVWSSGSQAVRADGWWASRLGATGGPSADEVPYAHHPPLVRVEVAVAEMALGEHRWVDRLPALLSSLAAIWLCWGWLGACGFSPGPRSLGVLATASTAFLLTYGVMLNMEAVWLPFAFGLLWAWQHAERRGGGFWSCFLIGLIGCTAAHQGMLLVGGLAVWAAVAAVRQRRRPEPHELGVMAAAVGGVAVFLVWVIWASGGLSDLLRIARQRTGNGVTWGEFIRTQATHASVVFGLLGLVCVVAAIVLVRSRRELLAPVVVLCAVTLAYAVGFREGAVIHEYWNVALVPVVSLGGALLGERLAAFGPRLVVGAGVAAAVLLLTSSVIASRAVGGDGAGLLAREAGSRGVTVLYTTDFVSDWLTYESASPVKSVHQCASVSRLAARDADALVLTSRNWIESQRSGSWPRVAESPDTTTTWDGYVLTSARHVASAC